MDARMHDLRRVVLGGLVVCLLSALPSSGQMVRIHQAGVYELAGQVIRCGPGERTGVEIKADAVVVHGGHVEGCQVGVSVRADGVMLRGMKVSPLSIGFLATGDDGWFEENEASGHGIGFVVTGDGYTLLRNRSLNNTHAGFVITGDANLLDENEATGNGQVGIYVGSMVPLVRGEQAVQFIRDRGRNNVFRNNIMQGNGLDLGEYFTAEDCPENTWEGNVFTTSELPPPCELE